MDSSLLAARAAGGDLEAFGQLYDAYFARVYDLAWRILRDADAAADVTRRTFEGSAQALRRIPADDVRSWLLLTAAQDALARAERSAPAAPTAAPEEAFGTFDVPDPCRLADPSLTRGDHELPCAIWEAATHLGRRDYAALDLSLRQGLPAGALAPLLQVPKGSAAPLLGRLQREADEAMRTDVLARRGGKDCERLRAVLLDAGFPPYSDAARQAVEAHLAGCATCQANRALPAAPSAILAALVPLEPPFILKGDVWRSVVGAWPARTSDAIAAAAPALMARSLESGEPAGGAGPRSFDGGGGAGGYDGGDGFGWYGEPDDGRRNVIWFAAAAIGMLAIAFIVAGLAVGAFRSGGGGGGAAAATRTPTPVAAETATTTAGPGVTVDTPTPAPSPSATGTPTETPVPVDTATPVPPTPTPPPPTPTPRPSTPASTPTLGRAPSRTPVVRTPTPRP